MTFKLLKNLPYFLAASLILMVLPLSACNESGLDGGEDLPGISQEPTAGATDGFSPEVTDEPSSGVTEEPSPGTTEDPSASEGMPQTGTIESLDLEANRLTLLLDNGENMEITVDELLTQVTIGGSAGTLQDLQSGDSVEVVLDEATGTASSITIGS